MYSKEYLNSINKMLNNYLSNANVLYTKVRNFHYNITGIEFFEIHEHFEKFYHMLEEEMDLVAERMLMLKIKPLASLKDYLHHSEIKEIESKDYVYKEAITQTIEDFNLVVLKSHEIIEFASEHKDHGTADLFTRTIQDYEKALWMLSAMLKQ
jgi:starvation-inducible DNA-binding protein